MLPRRYYFILFLIAYMIISPQASHAVLAEDSMDNSVWQNLNKDGQEDKKSEVDPANEVAETDGNEAESEDVKETDSLSVSAFDFIKMFFALAFVLALVYFLLKFVTKRNRFINQGQAIVNLGGTSLGQNKSIQMVKIGDRVLVVGVGESISLLKEIDNIQERKELIQAFELKQEQMVVSKDLFQKVTSFINQNKRNQTPNVKSTPFSKAFNEQLENLKKERTKQLEEVKRRGLKKDE